MNINEVLIEARKAQAEARWEDAEALWRHYASEVPGDPRGLAGIATGLILQGRLDDAAVAARQLCTSFPENRNGPALLAQVAARSRDFAAAKDWWNKALQLDPVDQQALLGKAKAAQALRHFGDVEKCAAELLRNWPASDAGYVLHAQAAVGLGNLPESIARWERARERFPNSDAISKGLIDAIARQNRTLREKIRAAVQARRTDEAIEDLTALVRSRVLQLSDAGLVIGVVNCLVHDERHLEVRAIVRSFLKATSAPLRRLAALNLSRVIWAYFGRDGVERSYRERTRTMISHSEIQPAPKTVLLRLLQAQDRISLSSSVALLDSDVSPSQGKALIDIIRHRLANKEPFSLIRMGDGETNFLPYEPALVPFALGDTEEREIVWWGKTVSPERRALFAERVLDAVQSADCIGLPMTRRYLRDLKLDKNDNLEGTRAGRGLRTILDAVETGKIGGPQNTVVTSAHVHQHLERWGLYPRLFEGLEHVSLVTCHPGLSQRFTERFGVPVANHIVVPPRAASRSEINAAEDGAVLPDIIEDVIAKLGTLAPGLTIVGAGYLGKWIVAEARKRGAVALDLGSIVDYWAGYKTRSFLDLG